MLRDENKDSDDDCINGDDERLNYLTDANMNVTALVDTNGDAVERYVYDPYGHCTVYNGDWSDLPPFFGPGIMRVRPLQVQRRPVPARLRGRREPEATAAPAGRRRRPPASRTPTRCAAGGGCTSVATAR